MAAGLVRVLAGRILSPVRPHLADDDVGKAAIALALAGLTVLATLVAGLQAHASIEASRGNRDAERLAIEAAGVESRSVLQVTAAYGTYRRWFEQFERSSWASATSIAEDFGPDAKLYDTLDEVEAAIEQWLTTQSDLLAPPYFDPESNVADLGMYETDQLTGPSTRLAEERDLAAAEAADWDAKANDYVTILTIVAVGLFFLGLAATVGARVRPFLGAAGLAFGLGSAVWTVVLATSAVHVVPPEAVDHVVASRVAADRVTVEPGPEPVTDAARAGLETAISEAEAAVASDPTYLSATRARADARLTLADALVLSGDGPSERTAELLDASIDDYRLVAEEDPEDSGVWWNLGWAAFLRGDLAASIEASGRALEIRPDEFTVHLNRAMARILATDTAGAEADVARVIELLHGPQGDSAGAYLSGTDYEFGRFAQLHPGQADALLAVRDRLREAQVGLRISGTPVGRADAPALPEIVVRSIEIGRYAYGRITEGPPLTGGETFDATSGVGLRVEVPASPELAGSTLSGRVWINGTLWPELGRDMTLDGGPVELDLVSPYGFAGFDMEPGAWEVELYLDGARRLRLEFTVTPRVDEPQFEVAASELVDALTAADYECVPDESGEEPTTICSGYFGDARSYQAVSVTTDEQDRITYLYLETTVYDETEVEPVARALFTDVADFVLPDDLAARATAWIEGLSTDVTEIELGGMTWRSFGAEEQRRFLDVWAPWPAG